MANRIEEEEQSLKLTLEQPAMGMKC